VVKAGDTLSAIADRYGTTVRVLVRLNDISDPSLLRVGQRLVLP
jgi:LysM repeat protein